MKDKIGISIAGFIGGIGPSLTEFLALSKDQKMPNGWFFVGALIMGFMGMTIVLIAKETVPWKAFTQGIGAPALFSTTATAASTVAFLLNPVPSLYAQEIDSFINLDSLPKYVAVKIDGIIEMHERGEKIILEKDSLKTIYQVPDKDTVSLKLKVYDPSLRRAFFQGLFPMQKKITNKFEKKLIVEEIK